MKGYERKLYDQKTKGPKGKAFRALNAIVATDYDVQTKMVLVLYAKELRWYRDDWDAWPGVRALAKGATLTQDTVIARRKVLIRDKILVRVDNEQNRTGFKGRPAYTYRLNVRRLEALARLAEQKAKKQTAKETSS